MGKNNIQPYMERLRELRMDSMETQAEVATYLGTSQTMYARYERGANQLPIKHLIALCKHYNVSADDVIGTTPERKRKRTKREE